MYVVVLSRRYCMLQSKYLTASLTIFAPSKPSIIVFKSQQTKGENLLKPSGTFITGRIKAVLLRIFLLKYVLLPLYAGRHLCVLVNVSWITTLPKMSKLSCSSCVVKIFGCIVSHMDYRVGSTPLTLYWTCTIFVIGVKAKRITAKAHNS